MAERDSRDARLLPPHIVVLVHGNNGSPSDFDAVERALGAKFGGEQLLVVKSSANHQSTSLGVEIGGTRLAKEVADAVLACELDPRVPRYKLSMVGHSLGGLYARFAVVQLMDALSMLHMDYVSFVTICTPHLGSRRARGPSTIKNILRIGVHKVLATKKIYGQTGIDLLMDTGGAAEAPAGRFSFTSSPPVQDAAVDRGETTPTRPLLEVMSDPDSEFIRALKKFKHGTLVAMTDGDVVVPFPSASMRSYSPYKSTFLTERFVDWRWHVRHFGFKEACGCDPDQAAFVDRLDAHVDHSIAVDENEAGLDATSAPRFPSIEGYDCDNKHEVEFPHSMLCHQQQAKSWRRIDVTVEPGGVKGKMRLHDWPINKMQPPGCCADEFIDLLCDMIGVDHGMKPVPQEAEADSPSALFGGTNGVSKSETIDATLPTSEAGFATASSTSSPSNVSSDVDSGEYPTLFG